MPGDDQADLVAAAVAAVIGIWLLVRRDTWGRDVMGIQIFGKRAAVVVAVVGVLFLIAAIWLLSTGLA